MKNINKATRILVLMFLWFVAAATLQYHRQVRGLNDVTTVMQNTMRDLDQRGRIPLVGYAGGMINNVWQTATGHAEDLGCGGQASLLYTRLQGVPGWHFQMRYEYGFKSPILLPHQWVTGYGPHGEVVDLDPWSGTEVELI